MLFLLFFWLAGTAGAHPAQPLPGLAGPVCGDELALPRKFKARFAKVFPAAPLAELQMQWFSSVRPSPETTKSGDLLLWRGDDRDDIARAAVYLHGTTMRIDVRLDDSFQQAGLYAFVMQQALRRFPETQSLPAQMPCYLSANAKAFFAGAFDALDDAKNGDVLQQTPAHRRAARARWLHSVRETAALQVRARLGFARLTQLLVVPETATVEFQVVRGEPLRDEHIRVGMFLEGVYWNLGVDGYLRRVTQRAFALPNYVFFLRD